MRRSARTGLFVWAAITVLVAASLSWIYLRMGSAGFGLYIQQPPLTNLPVTLASVALLWVSTAALLALIHSGRVDRTSVLSVAGFFLVCWAYLNFLSERVRYGDYAYYFEAANRMYSNQPLPATYFYAPLWATLLQFLAPLGADIFFLILWLLNFFSLLLCYILLLRILQRYGFSPPFAAVVTAVFMLANAPLLRTLAYVQVNLHALNLVLLGMLLYPKRSFLSALALALAVHLKTSPAVLVLAFLLEKDWRWLAWFAMSMLALAGVTLITDGISPFLDSLHNIQGLAASANTIFHDTSFDSFMRFIGPALGIGALGIRIAIVISKILLAAGSVAVMLRCVRTSAFIERSAAGIEVSARGSKMLNALPPLFILMTLASPVVWEHHGVFVALSFLLMLKQLQSPSDWMLFGLAYLLEFLLPTFDFFPWSFGRLVAPLIILWLMWKTAAPKMPHASRAYDKLNLWFKQALT